MFPGTHGESAASGEIAAKRVGRDRRGWILAFCIPAVVCACGCFIALAEDADSSLRVCEWCGADEAPAELSWETRIAGPDEPGERLVVSGTVVRADGTTPAADVVLYLYHTNREGVYPRRGGETGNARRHGYLRAWLRTDERGRYRFTTIRPGAYPGRSEPAHIHVNVLEPGKPEDYLDSFVFDDDPLLTLAERSRLKGRGGSGILRLRRGEGGAWQGTRDIVLMRE